MEVTLNTSLVALASKLFNGDTHGTHTNPLLSNFPFPRLKSRTIRPKNRSNPPPLASKPTHPPRPHTLRATATHPDPFSTLPPDIWFAILSLLPLPKTRAYNAWNNTPHPLGRLALVCKSLTEVLDLHALHLLRAMKHAADSNALVWPVLEDLAVRPRNARMDLLVRGRWNATHCGRCGREQLTGMLSAAEAVVCKRCLGSQPRVSGFATALGSSTLPESVDPLSMMKRDEMEWLQRQVQRRVAAEERRTRLAAAKKDPRVRQMMEEDEMEL